MQKYCLGFLFYSNSVLLIEKLKPDWQKGKLNGIGGHVEENETPDYSMIREFKEETSLDLPIEWDFRGKILGPDYEVYLYSCQYEDYLPLSINEIDYEKFNIDSNEGKISFHNLHYLPSNVLDNIPILVPILYIGNSEVVLNYSESKIPTISVSLKGNI